MQKNRYLLDLLKRVKCFSVLDEETLDLLRKKMRLEVFEPGDVLCREGEAGDKMFLIEFGEVAVQKSGENDLPVEVNVIRAGEITGVMSLFREGVRSATLRARTPTQAWVLDYSTFQTLIDQHSALAKGLLSSLSHYLSHETAVVAKLLSHGSDQRFRVAFFDSKPYTEEVFRKTNRYGYALTFYEPRLSLETVPLAAGFKAICVFVNDILNAAVIQDLHAMGVELIACRCAGYNNIDLQACERFGIAVTRVPAYSPYAVAEHAVALMLALNRRLHRAYNRVREHNFSLNGLTGFDMHGKTVGIAGMGKIGACLANIMAGFGCRVLAYDKYPDRSLEERLGVSFVEFDELLAASDIISLHAPLTPETHHIIDAVAIAKMRRGVMLINTSRGALVDAHALLEGLKNGKIGYAGLDVYEEEGDYFFEDLSDRVMPDDVLARLTTFNNVLITSHQAFLTQEALCKIAETTFENIREFESGKRKVELTNYVCMTP
jgi:D-lactate dehydrogenase